MSIPSKMTCEAHAKGFKPVTKLWYEVRNIYRCTQSQFSDAMSNHPSDIPSIRKIRAAARQILDAVPEVQRDTFRSRCASVNRTVEDIYHIYMAEHPDHTICYERFRQAASEPYTTSEYRIAKAADEIIERLKEQAYEEADSKDHP